MVAAPSALLPLCDIRLRNIVSIRYPYSRQNITEADIAAVTDALRSPLITQGPRTPAFEQAFSKFLGGPEVVACANGTAALHMAYMALDLGPKRGLLTSPITFLSTANAARMCGAPVVFGDVDRESGNLDPEAVRKLMKTTATPIAVIAPVHLGGRPCDMIAFRSIADEFGCALVEDACHAPGAYYFDGNGTPYRAGSASHSEAACFSFHAVKHIAMGEGGAVATRRADLAERIQLSRTHGMVRNPAEWKYPPEQQAPWYYEMPDIGYNYRLTDIQSALGLSQLSRLDDSLAARRRIASVYDALLSDVKHLRTQRLVQNKDSHAWHLYQVAIDFSAIGKSRGQLMRELAAHGIGTQVHYIPLNRQPYYRESGQHSLQGADAFYERTLSIPMYPELTEDDQAEIAAAIRDVLSQ